MEAIIVGGSGYMGTHLAQALYVEGHTVTIVDPIAPPADWTPVTHTTQPVSTMALDREKQITVYWLAGPRNHSSPREVKLFSYMIECEFARFLETLPRAKVVLVSSMSVYDSPDNTYAQHKRNMELILDGHKLIRNTIVRPGTVIGCEDETPILRADLGVHRALRAMAETGLCWVNLDLVRAYTSMSYLIDKLVAAGDVSWLGPIVEAYQTVAPMSALFAKINEGVTYKSDPNVWNFNGQGAFSSEGLEEVRHEVARTLARLCEQKVAWI